MIVVTKTPLRISFFGGGTDIESYYREATGAVLCTAINKYLYVTLKDHGDIFDEPFRINYSTTELVSKVNEIRNDIVRETFKFFDFNANFYVSTIADLPSASGLGSSSAFSVGLLGACHRYLGHGVSLPQLADQACHIEIERLGKPIGRQDQYATALGGLNFLTFLPDHQVSIQPILISTERLSGLFSSFLLFWTGIKRSADDILTEQKKNAPSKRQELDRMKEIAVEGMALLKSSNFNLPEFGALLHEGWSLKRRLAQAISSSAIDDWYEAARGAGAWGGKICGAGGGGFLLVAAPPERHQAIREVLAHLHEVPISFDQSGTRILVPQPI